MEDETQKQLIDDHFLFKVGHINNHGLKFPNIKLLNKK